MAKRGRKLLVLTRPVDFDELEQEIRSARREKMPRYLERLQSLRALAQGDSRKKVANRVGRQPQTVRAWIKAWNESGFEGLRPEFKGDPSCNLSEEQIEELKNDLRRPPSEFGYLSGLWEAKVVHHHIEKKFGVTYNFTALYRSLKNWGIKLRSPRPQSTLQDPKKVEHYWTETVPTMARKKRVRDSGG